MNLAATSKLRVRGRREGESAWANATKYTK